MKNLLQINENAAKFLFISGFAVCFLPIVHAPTALLIGIVVAQFIGNPYPTRSAKISKKLLQLSVIMLGFKMDLFTTLKAGGEGVMLTIITISVTLLAGYFLGKLFKLDKKMAFLISSGTAICGGSAIAAVSSSIKPTDNQITVSLGIVFILNAIGLFIFPQIGTWLGLSQVDFGTWSAIAIHDTSAVVGASGKYGAEALEVATTIKLTRALWIMPLTLVAGMMFKEKSGKIKIPYFIFYFILAMVVYTFVSDWLPESKEVFGWLSFVGKRGLVVTLYLIGASLSFGAIKSVGPRALFMGVSLWIIISVLSFLFIYWPTIMA